MKRRGNQIYLFRHGRTRDNVDGEFSGWHNTGLVKSGMDDARIVAERLKKKKFQVAIHSSLVRSKQTLNIVLKNHPECRLILQDDRMIERNYGIFNTHSHLEIVREYGPEKYDLWHRSWRRRPPGGESFKDVEKRVKSFVRNLRKFIKRNNCNVAISAHGNSIRLFRRIMEGLSIKETTAMGIPYDKVYEYEV